MTRVILRLLVAAAVLAGLAWYLEPLYAPPRAAPAVRAGTNDYVRWTVHSITNDRVYQQVTVWEDGSSEAVWTRAIGDPDLPEPPALWRPRLSQDRQFYVFQRTNALASATARDLFQRARDGGLADVVDRPAPAGAYLVVSWVLGDHDPQHARGPLHPGSAFSWDRGEWIRNLRWQEIASPAMTDPALAPLLRKTDILLVNDDGSPAEPAP